MVKFESGIGALTSREDVQLRGGKVGEGRDVSEYNESIKE